MKKLFAFVVLYLAMATGAVSDGLRSPSFGGASLPAVSGLNGKFEAFGGEYTDESLAAVAGSISFPLDRRYGAQIDTLAGSFAGDAIWGVGAHLFWRDPSRGLLGVYGDYIRWDGEGGNEVTRVAGEGALYMGRLSLESTMGAEFGEQKDRFFERTNVAYYPHDDLRLFVGHRYLGGDQALALGAEWQVAPRGVALFVEGLVADDAGNSVLGGVRIYFGSQDKSLIRRHREDDPENDLKNGSQSLTGNVSKCGSKHGGSGAPASEKSDSCKPD